MNLFKSTKLWIAIFLLTITSSFGQNNQKDPNKQSTKVTKCKAPIGVSLEKAWDIFANGSFTYWNPSQENMELGIVSDTSNPTISTLDGNFIDLDSDYKPGFKVGIGMNITQNNWDIYLQYTWFRGHDHTTVSLNPTGNDVLFPKWEIPDIAGPKYFTGKEDWRLHMDLLDFELGKEYCIESMLSFRSFFGLRAAWIRQSINVDYLNETTGLLLNRNVFITQRSHSWALGPRIGVKANWMLGKGFRIYGDGSGDILFTRYTKIRINQQATTASGIFATSSLYNVKQKNVNTLRGHLELELGFGWGTCFQNNSRYLDFSAGYNFQIFFDQNMFRLFLDDQSFIASLMPNSNLFIHGLIATLSLNF